jgi:hypothetical protein
MAPPFESRQERWNGADLEFFDPFFEGKSLFTAESMTHSDKDTFFRDVHLFIDRAKDFSTVEGC